MNKWTVLGLSVLTLGVVMVSMAVSFWGIEDRRLGEEAAEVIQEIRATSVETLISPVPIVTKGTVDVMEGTDSTASASPVAPWEDLFSEWVRRSTNHREWPALRDTYFSRLTFRDWPKNDIPTVIALNDDYQPFWDDFRNTLNSEMLIPVELLELQEIWGTLPTVLDISNGLFLDILVAGARGDMERVIATCRVGMALADRVAASAPNDFQAWIYSSRIHVYMVEALEQSEPFGELDRDQTLALVEVLNRPMDWDGLYRAHTLSFAERIELREQRRQDKLGLVGLNNVFRTSSTPLGVPGKLVDWGVENTLNRNKYRARRKKSVDSLLRIKELKPIPYHRIDEHDANGETDEVFWYTRNRMVYPSYAGTRMALARVGLLAELYQRETGRVAETLADMEASYGVKLGRDEFTGKPFVYKPDGDGFLLYALGRSGRDYDGAHEGPRFNHDVESRNIVWRGPLYFYDADPTSATDEEWAALFSR